MTQKLHYGFLDESGILENKAKTGNYFVISSIIVGHPSELKQIMKQARRKAKGKFNFHKIFKASKENQGFVKLVLQEIAKRNINIISGIWDKRNGWTGDNKNVLYFKLVTKTVTLALEYYPKLNLIVHKRYTLPRIREQLDYMLSEAVVEGRFLSISHLSERECRELELADAVAWAFFQKYSQHNLEFYNIIKDKIQIENRLAA